MSYGIKIYPTPVIFILKQFYFHHLKTFSCNVYEIL